MHSIKLPECMVEQTASNQDNEVFCAVVALASKGPDSRPYLFGSTNSAWPEPLVAAMRHAAEDLADSAR